MIDSDSIVIQVRGELTVYDKETHEPVGISCIEEILDWKAVILEYDTDDVVQTVRVFLERPPATPE